MGRHKARMRNRKSPILRNEPVTRNVVGFCYSHKHRGYITKKALDAHKCLEKGCNKFEKVESYYWHQVTKEFVSKKLRKFYRSNTMVHSYKTEEDFIKAVKLYYGDYESVPIDEDNRLCIQDFLSVLNN